MNQLDQDIETIIQILKENTIYSPQARVYIINGAIAKLIQWRDSFINIHEHMQLMNLAEPPRLGAAPIQQRITKYIVMHAHAIWKGYFFDTAEQAAGVLRDTLKSRFKTMSGQGVTVFVDESDGSRYTIKPIMEFLGMQDFQLPQA